MSSVRSVVQTGRRCAANQCRPQRVTHLAVGREHKEGSYIEEGRKFTKAGRLRQVAARPLPRPSVSSVQSVVQTGIPRSPLFSARSTLSLRGLPKARRSGFPPAIFRDNARRAARPCSHSSQVAIRGRGVAPSVVAGRDEAGLFVPGSAFVAFAFDFIRFRADAFQSISEGGHEAILLARR